MNRPQLMGNGSRGAAAAPRDPDRLHQLTAGQLTPAHHGRTVTIADGPARVTLTASGQQGDCTTVEIETRDGRTGTRSIPAATPVLIHRRTTDS